MISRYEFYIVVLIICALFLYLNYSSDTYSYEVKKAKLEVKDNIIMLQRDSALALAMSNEKLGDSLILIINKKNANIDLITKKHEKEKNSIRSMDANDALRFFISTATPSN